MPSFAPSSRPPSAPFLSSFAPSPRPPSAPLASISRERTLESPGAYPAAPPAAFPAASPAASPTWIKCAVCLDEMATLACVPCGHLCLCADDAARLSASGATACPMCRTPVKSTIRVYF
jgi:hypothetical protein